MSALFQVAGVRSNLWQGAAAVASGAAFTNVYVGWGIKTERFLPLPPPPVAQEYDQVISPMYLTCHAPHKVQYVLGKRPSGCPQAWTVEPTGCVSNGSTCGCPPLLLSFLNVPPGAPSARPLSLSPTHHHLACCWTGILTQTCCHICTLQLLCGGFCVMFL